MRRVFLAALILFFAAPAHAARTILVVGDSLSAAYRMDTGSGWVALLQQRLDREKAGYTVVNASIPGDITASGLARLPRLLAEHKPAIVILELGGNDGLLGLPLERMKHNIAAMIQKARADGAKVLLVGIELPPNYGKPYTDRFHRVFRELAAQEQVPLVPFLLQGIATHRELMQPDGIHANAKAQPLVLANVWRELKLLL